MRLPHLVLVACTCSVLGGCGSKPVDVVGKWKLNTPVPIPGATSTDETFAADHTATGIYGGTWSLSGNVFTLKITTIGTMSVDQLKSMMANQPNGAAAAKMFDDFTLIVDSAGRTMSVADAKGNASSIAMFTRQ